MESYPVLQQIINVSRGATEISRGNTEICCSNEKVVLAEPNIPLLLQNLLSNQEDISKHFCDNICLQRLHLLLLVSGSNTTSRRSISSVTSGFRGQLYVTMLRIHK